MPGTTRRQLLASTACALAIGNLSRAVARTYSGALPWEPFDGSPRAMERPGPWQFFTHDEAAAIEAIVDRLIPRDELSAGGKDAGCADFIDRQLRGPFGDSRQLYMRPPFAKGMPEQGQQSSLVPAQRYRVGLRRSPGRYGFAASAALQRRAHGIWPGYLSGCLFGLSHRTGPRRQSSLSKACPQPGRPVRQRDDPHSCSHRGIEKRRYWTLKPLRSTGVAPALASSMKSLVNVAPELPPPP